MKKYIACLILMNASSLYAGTKVTSLTSDSAPLATDITYEVKDPGGTPASKRISIGDLMLTPGTTVQHSSGTITNLNVTKINGSNYPPTSGGSAIYNATSTPTFPFGVNATSFTATGSTAGSLTLKDTAGTNFVSIESSGTLTYNQAYVLPNSTAPAGQVLTIAGPDGNGKVGTYWGTGGGDVTLGGTQTFSGINTFANTVNVTNISSTTFTNVSSMTFDGSDLSILANSTVTILGAINANGSYGVAGQVLNSNGPGASVSWGAGGGGGAGYFVEPATVTFNLAQGILASTMDVSGFVNLAGSVTFSGVTSTVTFNTQSTVFNNVSTITINNASLVVTTGTIQGIIVPLSQTLAQLQVLAPSAVGLIYYCSDCSTDGIVISTGTAIAAFGRVSARTTAPQ